MKVSASLLALATVLLPSAPAWSSVYSVDWTGIIYDGEDVTGVFGQSGSLIGETAHLIFRVDTKTPGAIHLDYPEGMDLWGLDASAPVTASIIIKGVTFQLMSKPVYVPSPPFDIYEVYDIEHYRGGASEANFSGKDSISQAVNQVDNVQVFSNESFIWNQFNDQAEASGASFISDIADADVETAPISHVFTIDDQNVFASFHIQELFRQQFFDGRPPDVKYENIAFGRFIPTSYTVKVEDAGGAVPEPAAWTLMMLGFGAIGAALRRTLKLERSAQRKCLPRPIVSQDQDRAMAVRTAA